MFQLVPNGQFQRISTVFECAIFPNFLRIFEKRQSEFEHLDEAPRRRAQLLDFLGEQQFLGFERSHYRAIFRR